MTAIGCKYHNSSNSAAAGDTYRRAIHHETAAENISSARKTICTDFRPLPVLSAYEMRRMNALPLCSPNTCCAAFSVPRAGQFPSSTHARASVTSSAVSASAI